MKALNILFFLLFAAAFNSLSFAHCDGEDGPVVIAAKKALTEKNINLVLVWVQPKDEQEIKTAFDKTIAVSSADPAVKELAEKYFYETVVRVHRMGEGAAYTGVKPAGFNNDPSVLTADKSIENGSLAELYKILTEKVHNGLHSAYEKVVTLKNYDKNDVEAGRKYIAAYVNFLHYAEGIYKAAGTISHSHEHTENH